MKILIYIGHPAQYMFLRETINQLSSKGIKLRILIKSKDILETLLQNDNQLYTNILVKQIGNSIISIFTSLLKRIYNVYHQTLLFKPNIMIGTDSSFSNVRKLLHVHRTTITEDDYEDNGILFESSNPHDLAKVLKILIDDPNLFKKFSSNLGAHHFKHNRDRSEKSIKTLFKIFLK